MSEEFLNSGVDSFALSLVRSGRAIATF